MSAGPAKGYPKATSALPAVPTVTTRARSDPQHSVRGSSGNSSERQRPPSRGRLCPREGSSRTVPRGRTRDKAAGGSWGDTGAMRGCRRQEHTARQGNSPRQGNLPAWTLLSSCRTPLTPLPGRIPIPRQDNIPQQDPCHRTPPFPHGHPLSHTDNPFPTRTPPFLTRTPFFPNGHPLSHTDHPFRTGTPLFPYGHLFSHTDPPLSIRTPPDPHGHPCLAVVGVARGR